MTGEIAMDEKTAVDVKRNTSDERWKRFMETGAVSDYLAYASASGESREYDRTGETYRDSSDYYADRGL